jgi:heat-inducible transcriptional repressor
MTRGVGIAAAIPASPALDQVELVALPDRRVLMVVMTRDQQVRNRVVTLDQAFTSDELASIRNYINRNFSGWLLEDVRRELSARLDQAAAAYDDILRKLTLLYSKGLLEVEEGPEVHMEGASNLFMVDLRLTHDKMRELLRALEEKRWNCSTGSWNRIPIQNNRRAA